MSDKLEAARWYFPPIEYLDLKMHYLDLSIWPRRKHFEFFRRYEHPFFNVTVDVHHALVDGLNVGDFFAKLEANFADPPT